MKLFICLVSFQILATEIPWDLAEGEYKTGISYKSLATKSRFDLDGNESQLADKESFNVSDINLFFSYGWSKEFEVGASLIYRQVSDQAFNSSTNQLFDNSIAGAYGLTPYLKYKFLRKSNYVLSLRADYGFKLFNNEKYQNSLFGKQTILGDDGAEIRLGFTGGYFFYDSPFSFYSNLFFRNPGKNLSEEFVFDLIGRWQKNKIGIYLGLNNVFSMGRDQFSEDPSGKPIIVNPTASNLFNSIDRSWRDLFVGVDYRINNNFSIGLNYQQRLEGSSTDKNNGFKVSLLYSGDSGIREERARNEFKSYAQESLITKVSSKNKYIVIDRGITKGVKQGMSFDIYDSNFTGKQVLVAKGRVVVNKAYKAVIKIIQRFSKKKIAVGMVARGR